MKKLYILIVLIVIGVDGHYKNEIRKFHKKHYDARRGDVIDGHVAVFELRCPGIRAKIPAAKIEMEECVRNLDDSLTLCERFKIGLLNCTSHIVKLIDDCVPPDDKGLLRLLLESYVSVINFLCKETGESLLELTRNCATEEVETSNAELIECKERIGQIARRYRENGTSKRGFCTDFTGFRHCIKKRIELTCPNPKTRHVFVGFYDAFIKPCSQIV